jgi:hypothetical protein
MIEPGGIARSIGFFIVVCTVCYATEHYRPEALKCGEGSRGPWWMKQTAMTKQGKLDLSNKPWWKQAKELQVGQSFIAEASGPAKGHMLVRREICSTRAGNQVDALVWVLDDDADGSITTGGDKDSDCYVADYGADGLVDRMVDYIDDDGDNDPDEMDIRYFTDGKLNYSWFGMDLDDDSAMWSLRGYEYGGPSFFEADPYGDGMICMNKLNPKGGVWSPISECPFAFYDTDCDGYSEMVIRVSAVPIGYDVSVHPDYANTSYALPWSDEMEQMGIANIRYSFDVDNGSDSKTPLHYEMGFNLVGSTPYRFAGMKRCNAKRRPPQVICVTPWENLPNIANRFEADQTGYSWHENFDDTVAIGYADHEKNDYRWEGVFWIWERRFMENTGGPCQKWNVRREWNGKPTTQRDLYYSDVDKRIHLFGAEEGWLQIGHFGGLDALGEIRTFDTDGNGYFDRWEVYLGEDPTPVRVSTVRDERAFRLDFDLDSLTKRYTEEILPQAMAANEKFMAAMSAVDKFEIPKGLQGAMETGSDNFRRYAQDVARELQYQAFRKEVAEQAHQILRAQKTNDLRRIRQAEMPKTKNSQTAWMLLRTLTELDTVYGQGKYDKACQLICDIAELREALE